LERSDAFSGLPGILGGVTFLSIAYVSSATQPMSDDDIAAILTTSRANNSRDGLTGALLYHGGRFVQILEGPESQVRTKFATISSDTRHRNVQVMRERSILDRQFPQWTMGFRELGDDSVKQLEGFEDILGRRGKARLEHAENEAQQFLEWLGEYWLPRR
jgi:hypothetical protein